MPFVPTKVLLPAGHLSLHLPGSWKLCGSALFLLSPHRGKLVLPSTLLKQFLVLKKSQHAKDYTPGITAGKAAGMAVVAIPSVPNQTHVYSSTDEVINSLLDLHLENWDLPPFQDWIEGTSPIGSWYIGGPVIKGYGHCSKAPGIPIGANFPSPNDLIERIREDRRIAEKALDLPLYSSYNDAPYLMTPLAQDDC